MSRATTSLASCGLLGIALAMSSAAQATVTWSFSSSHTTSVAGLGTGNCALSTQSCYGATRTWNGTGAGAPTVTGSAWADTGGARPGTQLGQTIQNAYLPVWSGGLGVVNRGTLSSTTAAWNTNGIDGGEGAPRTASTSSPEHAVDNNGNGATNGSARYVYDSVLFTFSEAVILTGVTIGWPSTTSSYDTDISLLAFTGSTFNAQTDLNGKTYQSLATSSNWTTVGNYANLQQGVSKAVAGEAKVPTGSKYWLISAYNPIFGNGANLQTGNDYFKILALAGTTYRVPEPGALGLLLSAGASVVVVRRLRKRTQQFG